MIVAVAFTTLDGDAIWAVETAPYVDAFPALAAALDLMKPTWPSEFAHDEYDVFDLPESDLGSAVNFAQLRRIARYDVNDDAGAADASGLSVASRLHVLRGAAGSDVLCFVFAFCPNADDKFAAAAARSATNNSGGALPQAAKSAMDAALGGMGQVAAAAGAATVASRFARGNGAPLPRSDHVGTLTDAVQCARAIADAVRSAVVSNYVPYSGRQVELTAGQVSPQLHVIAGRVNELVSQRYDMRNAHLQELLED